MNAREKVLELERQIIALIKGEVTEMYCPFCNQVTMNGQFICCENAADIVNAVLNQIEFNDQRETVDQIFERIAAMPDSRIILN